MQVSNLLLLINLNITVRKKKKITLKIPQYSVKTTNTKQKFFQKASFYCSASSIHVYIYIYTDQQMKISGKYT